MSRGPDWRRRLAQPALLNIRPGPLVSIYAWRLRHHAVQELLAGAGIAIGVALVFGVLTASQSMTGSAGPILHAITGKATLEVAARSPDGFDEKLAERIGELPGVRVASPILRADAVIKGPGGQRSVQLVGATVSLLTLEGAASRYLGSSERHIYNSLAITSSLAAETGAGTSEPVTLLARGRANSLPVHAVWGAQQIGAVSDADIAASGLSTVQRLLGLPHRVTQVWVEPDQGSEQRVRAGLERLAAGRVDVNPINHDLALLDATAKPSTESSRLFAAIGGIVGFLFVLNAMLLTVPERRRWVAEARMQGYSAPQVLAILGFQALALGVFATCVGLLIGYLLTTTLFGALPSLLRLYFPIGDHPIVTAPTVALAAGAGLLATLIASAAPLRDLSPRRPIDAVLHDAGKVGHDVTSRMLLISGFLGLVAILAAVVLAVSVPSQSAMSGALLGLAALSTVPPLLDAVIAGLMPLAERLRRSMLAIALTEVRGMATRSIALAGVAALAVYGSVTVMGAREDLVRGLDAATVDFFANGEVWVTPMGNNPLLTDGFDATPLQAAIGRIPAVATVRTLQASLLDVGSRRLWVRARPPADRELLQASQLMRGSLARATSVIRAGGWAAVSGGFAAEHHLTIGHAFLLPTPAGPIRLRVAAITTNSGWPPGAITLNQRDYQRYWQTSAASALEITLKPGVAPDAGVRTLRSALATGPALRVQTRAERERQNERAVHQGVQNLDEISELVLIAAVLAITFALIASIISHGRDLASRKVEGYDAGQLWRVLLLETTVVVGVGALDGALLGILGHRLASRWLEQAQSFPAPFALDLPQLVLTLAIVAAVAGAIVLLVGSVVVRVRPGFDEHE
jgi:putative ABC transport system permease protein